MKVLIEASKFKKLYEAVRSRWGGGVLPYCPVTKRFLLQQRADTITSPNEWTVWGGKSDKGETIEQCCEREFREESGFEGKITKMVKMYTHKKKSFTWYNFIGFVAKEFKPPMVGKVTIDGEIEVQNYKWLTLDEIIEFKGGKKHSGLNALIKQDEKKIRKLCSL